MTSLPDSEPDEDEDDNILCPECRQDDCICEISENDYYDDYNANDPEELDDTKED